jgi:3-methylfumaryl-CoA hydratase
MPTTLAVGDVLPPLQQSVSPFQLFRYSAVTWNPHRIHFDEEHAHAEGHRGLALHSHLRAALALRAVTEGLGPGWRITTVAYRLRRPLYAPVALTYTARVTAADDDRVTVELIEENPSGEVGFEGTVAATRVDIVNEAPQLATAGATS